MQYTYLDGSNVYIYPSANATDSGNINKEVNIAGLVTSIVPKDYIISYKLRDPSIAHESLEVDRPAGLSATEFNLYSGSVVLNGRRIDFTFDPEGTSYQTFDLSTLYDGTISSANTLYLLVVPFFAASGNILGDSYQNVNDVVTRECRGVALTAVDSLTGLELDHYVVVGEFNLISGSITSYTAEEESYKVFPDEKVKQVGIDSLTTGTYNVLLTPANIENGQSREAVYLTDNLKLRIMSGDGYLTTNLIINSEAISPLYLHHQTDNVYDFRSSELVTSTDGRVVPNYFCYECTTAAGTADKEISFFRYTIPTTGTLIKVKFSNSNTANDPTLRTRISHATTGYSNRSIYLQDGRVCPWYAISETSAIYEFVYDGNNSRWILLNPSAPLISTGYDQQGGGARTITVKWRESKGIVSVVAYMHSGTQSGDVYYGTNSKEYLPLPSYVSTEFGSATQITSNGLSLYWTYPNESSTTLYSYVSASASTNQKILFSYPL